MAINFAEMAEQELIALIEDLPENELLAQLDSLPDQERVDLLERIPEAIRVDLGFLSDQQIAFQMACAAYGVKRPAPAYFGGFCGKYGEMYKNWLEAYCPEEFWELLCAQSLGAACEAKNEEVGNYVENTVKVLLTADPAPDKNTHPLEWTAHMNALKAQAEEMAEPLMFGGCQRGELGNPKLVRPVATHGRSKNMFFDGTQEEWESYDQTGEDFPF